MPELRESGDRRVSALPSRGARLDRSADGGGAVRRHGDDGTGGGYPGSDFPPEEILSDDALAHVNKVGMALLGRTDPGTYPAPG